MPLHVLCRDHPYRIVVLVTDDFALELRHTPTTSGSLSGASYSSIISPRCMVEFSTRSSVDLSNYRLLGVGHGTLGLITLNGDVFLCIVTSASRVATVRPGETVQKIDSVEFYCLNRSDYETAFEYDGRSNYGFFIEDSDPGSAHDPREALTEHPFLALKKLLIDGSFYYSVDFDLTNRLQDRSSEPAGFDVESLDEALLWNSYMIRPLLQFRSRLAEHERRILDSSRILMSVIRGFVQSLTIPASVPLLHRVRSNLPSSLTLISRLSSRRAGTRFNSRGIDDDGNVANFVESETVLWVPSGICFSYTQVRGSVPIFWEQAAGLIPGQQKIHITRSTEATQPTFDKHFEGLELNYGAVHVVNLLSELKPGEAELTQRFQYHIGRSTIRHDHDSGTAFEHHLLRATEFDFHAETRGPTGYESVNLIRHKIGNSADGFAYFLSEDISGSDKLPNSGRTRSKQSAVILQQEGIFRTNCLDCLDRTNLVQTLISQMALEAFLAQRDGGASPDIWMRHSSLWADNGDSLSKIYAGTGALKSSFTRHGKMSLSGALADARKSATRLYVNNFADKGRQNTIDLLLGCLMGQNAVHLYDPISDFVNAELVRRTMEYSSCKTIRIWVGTFNLNGRSHGANENLSPWLLPHLEKLQEEPVIVAVGFQEIVELSPQQIMSTDPGTRRIWEEAVKKALNEHPGRRGTSEYVLLRTGQLVGAALLVFVKAEVIGNIKNVEGSVKKTGLSGMGGNKGGCAIRFEYHSTRICFVTAHLAAGFANYEERNRDYRTISHGLRFQRNRSIDDHDAIIWLGDFNYRIGLGDDRVRKLIQKEDLATLYENDQLHLQMVAGVAFPFYAEGQITFPPTYKYNNGTDIYDTSEKARIPAWCDRILWKGTILRQLEYDAAPLRFSDHRPVYATFDCTISVIDERLKEDLSRDLYDKQRKYVGNVTENPKSEDSDEGGVDRHPIAPNLPPASSDRHKWWLDQGLPVRSTINRPPGRTPNPRREPNPFSTTSESDWVGVPHPDISYGGVEHNIKTPSIVRSISPLLATQTLSSSVPQGLLGGEGGPLKGMSSGRDSTVSRSIRLSGGVRKRPPPVPQKPATMSGRSSPKTPDKSLPRSAPVLTVRKEQSSQGVQSEHQIHLSTGHMACDKGEPTSCQLETTPHPGRPRSMKFGATSWEQQPELAPRLPPRNPGPASYQRNGSELLGEDVDENLVSWKPLSPQGQP